jgi:hypothetical protein
MQDAIYPECDLCAETIDHVIWQSELLNHYFSQSSSQLR